ncbi:50S ribosomal protein L25 [Candidatus Clavichlamydia salmonicola]|uniref:50S ribosomal protein L25 n=1 Tax=Candidatus Clavichlamydia salmonicola TaxID=469812 RepID=UPI0018911C80|nr:50S ribosomal protein L25 [Candidatus Clavichlamydia salmonicola]
MKLSIRDRLSGKGSYLTKIRQLGDIPGVIYSKGAPGQSIVVDGEVFNKFLEDLETGTLSSTIFSLELEGKEPIKAIIKDIQYNVTTYQVIHLDFLELSPGALVSLKIPVKCINVLECVGVKLGGVLRQILFAINVRCKVEDICPRFELDVKNLNLAQVLKVSNLNIPSNIIPLRSQSDVVVSMVRR